MKRANVLASSLLAWLAFTSPAGAVTWYVAPSGTASSGCVSRDAPCSLASAAAGAVAGDTVILMDGVYKTPLNVANSGTAEAWITFKADDCSTPIIEGPGVAPEDGNKDTGVGSATATYLRFDGIVSRGWNTGFGNGWTGNQTPDSNGYWDIENCIGDMNGRTGFTFFSAPGVKLAHSISAHNGSSTMKSWSSGVTLYASPGGVIEANVSFENMDAQKHTDGSGFIADRSSHGASFVNNLAFFNGGSCLRLTASSNVVFVNNTCYHDAQDTAATGPTDPDEVYFSNAPSDMSTITGISFMNNALVALGTGAGLKAVNYTPPSGWASNVSATATVTHFAAPEGNNPDFTLASGATALLAMGSSAAAVPTADLGFDPKCVVKKTPVMIGMMAKGAWWQYSIDYDYIKSIGGVARCFNPKPRSGMPDIGSYANGAVTTAAQNTCVPPTTGGGGSAGGMTQGGSSSAGAASVAGSSATGGSMSSAPSTEANAGCSCRAAGHSTRDAAGAACGLLAFAFIGSRRRRARR
ncbi:MAG TPA: right-handed parallel beta-helix repeat-containing protein [Polyangiaceae bacterium]|nr:right-handed parallel beta-helix repeat-containing protein [Polyangiaceae bacterium]